MNQNPGYPDQNNPYWPYQSMPNDVAIPESLAAQPPQASTDPLMPGRGAGTPNMNAYGSSTEPAAMSGPPIAPGGNPISYDPLLAPPPPPPPPPSSSVPNPYGSYVYPPLPGENRPKRPGRRRAVLITVIILIVAIGVMQYGSYQGAQADNHATATALSIAQAANSKATGTAQANARATSVASTYPFFADLVLSDPLVDNTHAQYGWLLGGDSTGGCTFSDGAYQETINQRNGSGLCAGLLTNFSNFTFQADMTMKKGDKQSVGGFFFRGDALKIDGYAFTIDQQGVYTLWITANGSENSYRVLRSGPLSASQFTPGLDQTTTLAVAARGEQISLYVNQQLIITLRDSTYTKGVIGFVAIESGAATTVAFNNAKVWA